MGSAQRFRSLAANLSLALGGQLELLARAQAQLRFGVKRFSPSSGGRQGRHARPVGLQEGDGKCVLCPTYPLLERRFPLEAGEHRHRLSRTRPRLIAREQANAVVGCANSPLPFPRGRGRCCTTKSESYPKGAAADYPRKALAAGRLFRNLPCEFRRSHQRKFEDTSRDCRYAVDR
jgi:hypothetical protein